MIINRYKNNNIRYFFISSFYWYKEDGTNVLVTAVHVTEHQHDQE